MNEKKTFRDSQLHIFQSQEEAETYFAKKNAKQDPVSRLRETVELILRTYGYSREELNIRIPNNNIIVHRSE